MAGGPDPRSRPDLRSRVVAILKVGLPLVALGMLSALFLIQTDDSLGGNSIEFGKADMAALGSGLSVTNPVMSGTTAGNDRFRFTADKVVPDAAPPTHATMTHLAGQIELIAGSSIDLSAPTGDLDLQAQQIVLGGPVHVATSDGYRMQADGMRIDLTKGVLEATGANRTDGPQGSITAGSLRVEPSGAVKSANARLISFGKGVRVLYDPASAPK